MKKFFVVIVLSILTLTVSACAPKVPIACGDEILKVPLKNAQEYKDICSPDVVTVPENPEVGITSINNPEKQAVNNSTELEHLAYWTSATEVNRWPEMSQFSIVACHNDPDANGNAKIVFLVGNDIKTSDLQLIYYDGYSGAWSESVKNQIITEVQDSVRPHVPGFTLSTVEIVYINN